MIICGMQPTVLKFLFILSGANFCGSSTVDVRWNTGLLPEEEIVRIKGSLKDINYLLFDRSKKEWHPLHWDDPIPASIWQFGSDIKMIIHGYTFKKQQNIFEKLDEQNIWELGKGYAEKNSTYNVFIVEWTVLSSESLGRYYEASESTKYVGEEVARYLTRLKNESYITDWDRLHLLGFSLGGHTAGVVGAKVQELEGVKIGRITGIDPAGPNFEVEGKLGDDLLRVLDKSDAKFVDVIHCNMKRPGRSMLGYLGTCVESGHADFYPNGGERQKLFCTRRDDMGMTPCSHMLCNKFMRESLFHPLLACPCENWIKFQEGKCSCTLETGGVLMGDPCPTNASGNYFVEIKKLN